MSHDAQHCSFVLVADFDIDRGAQLTYQFPQPLGTDEGYGIFSIHDFANVVSAQYFIIDCWRISCSPMARSGSLQTGRCSS